MARNNVKYSILEIDNVELYGPTEHVPLAQDISFTDVQYTADNVNEAIVESSQYATGIARFAVSRFYNGRLNNSDWMGPSELGAKTPFIIVPFDSRITEISWANTISSVYFDIEFRLNSKTNPIFYTYSVSAGGPAGYTTGLTLDLSIGDSVYMQYIDQGRNVTDMDFTLWIRKL